MTYALTATSDAFVAGAGTTGPIAVTLTLHESVLAWCADITASGTYSVADTNGNTWTKVGSEQGDTHGYGCFFFCSDVTTGGATTITPTKSGSTSQLSTAYWRWSGLANVAAQTSSFALQVASSTAANSELGASVTPTSQPCMVFSLALDGTAGSAFTAGTTFTSRGQLAARFTAQADTSVAQDKLLTSTAPVQATMSQAATGTFANIWTVVLTVAGPSINTQPTDQTASVGASVTFSVSATANSGSLSYQWQDNSAAGVFANISGETSSTLTIPNVAAGHNGRRYQVVVTDSGGSGTSSSAGLYVNYPSRAIVPQFDLANLDAIGFQSLLDIGGWFAPSGTVGLQVEKWFAEELDAASGATGSGVGASAGTGTASGAGASTAASAGASSGTASASGTGASTVSAAGASSGTAAATGVGQAAVNAAGASSGVATAAAVGASAAASVAASSGTGAASGVGASSVASVGADSSGVGTASGVGASTAAAVGSSTGSSTATASSSATQSGAGSSSGVSTVSGVGASAALAVGASAGAATAQATGRATANSVGASTGTSTVTGVSNVSGAGAGAAAGASTASAVGAAASAAPGSSTGVSAATGVGAAVANSVGASSGVATVSGIGSSVAAGQAVGSASGSSIVVGTSLAIFNAIGQAFGVSDAHGVGIGGTEVYTADSRGRVGSTPASVVGDRVGPQRERVRTSRLGPRRARPANLPP